MKEIITDLKKLDSFDCKDFTYKKDNKNPLHVFFDNREELQDLIVEMKEIVRHSENCLGLAAPQIGVEKNIFVINFNGDIRTYINPIIETWNGVGFNKEGCMSIPGKQYLVPRYTQIKVGYIDPQGNVCEQTLVGLVACVFQHEYYHLLNCTIADIGLEITEEFEKASEEEKDKIVEEFINQINETCKELEKDSDVKEMNDALIFMKKMKKGEIELTKVDENGNPVKTKKKKSSTKKGDKKDE